MANATMAYFDPRLHTELIVDANLVSLGVILVQDKGTKGWNPVAYARKALSDTETRFAQIERGAGH